MHLLNKKLLIVFVVSTCIFIYCIRNPRKHEYFRNITICRQLDRLEEAIKDKEVSQNIQSQIKRDLADLKDSSKDANLAKRLDSKIYEIEKDLIDLELPTCKIPFQNITCKKPVKQSVDNSICPSKNWKKIAENICEIEDTPECGEDCAKTMCNRSNGYWILKEPRNPFRCNMTKF